MQYSSLHTIQLVKKLAIQISSGQLIGLSSFALTKLSNCYPAVPYTQQCQNPQTINYHTCSHCKGIGLAFLLATEVVGKITDYHVNMHLLHVSHFTLNQMQGNSM